MSLVKAREALSHILQGAPLTGRLQGKNQDPLLSSDLVIADDDTVVILSERAEGELAVSEFCKCVGGTLLGNQIRKALKEKGLPVKD